MTAIRIRLNVETIVVRDHWLFSLIQTKCISLAKVKICKGIADDLSWLPKLELTHLNLDLEQDGFAKSLDMNDLMAQGFIDFIHQNHQLQELHLTGDFDMDILRSLSGQLKQLHSLVINNYAASELTQPITMIKLENLI